MLYTSILGIFFLKCVASVCRHSIALQLPDLDKIKGYLEAIFGKDQIPPWMLRLAAIALLTAVILSAFIALLTALVKIKELLTNNIWPIFYNKEEARRSSRRRKFADHIESELRRLNNLEAWSDFRFTELEAEVDAEGRRRLFGVLPSFYRTGNTLRRERSLSRALKLSEERLIIVEGEPGSGKSVALRHVASLLAARAMKSRSTKSLIPIYVNLKEIERKAGDVIDSNLVEAFVLKVLNRVNNRDVEEFLDEEFHKGLQGGTWFFLFDSFDEIPEILSSTEADKSIREYASAISDFLHGLNECRGIIASRFFHGPKQFGWPRFRVLPLTTNRQLELIKRADLSTKAEGELIGQLGTAGYDIRTMAGNPMFLGLLCEHMRSGYAFPENSHTVLKTYIDSRLSRDKDRLFRRYRLQPDELRAAAEAAAFCMAADPGLGLSPTREDIKAAAQKLQVKISKNFDKVLDAITFLKLARADTSTTTDKSEQFTFAHRRFQEYFSTAVVLREPDRVTPTQLLLDARWRETAVVMCQTQPPETLSALIAEVEASITSFAEVIRSYSDDRKLGSDKEGEGVQEINAATSRFQWPAQALHVLGLLQEGFGRRLDVLSPQLRTNIGEVLTIASDLGTTADQKWALDVSATAPTEVFTELLRRAFRNRSQLIKDSAYRQIARLAEIPPDLAYRIRATLCLMALTGRLRKEKTATYAHLLRLNRPADFLGALRLLLWFPIIDFVFHGIVLIALLASTSRQSSLRQVDPFLRVTTLVSVVAIVLSYFSLYWNLLVSRDMLVDLVGRDLNPGATDKESVSAVILVFNNRSIVLVSSITVFFGFFLFVSGVEVLSVSGMLFPINGSILLTWLYAGVWASSALMFAIKGRFMSPVFWLILPALAAGEMIKTIVKSLWSAIADWKEVLRFLLSLVMFYACLGLVLYIGSFIPHYRFIAGFTAGIALLALIIYWLTLRIFDFLKWQRWTRLSEPLSANEFIAEVRYFKLQTYRVRFISAVRTRGLLVVSPETEEVIYNFAKELEAPESETVQTSILQKIARVLRPYGKKTKGSNPRFSNLTEENPTTPHYIYGVAVLDEVLRLLEQVRAAG